MMKKIIFLSVTFFAMQTTFSQEIYKGNVQINAGLNLLTSPHPDKPLTNIENRINGDLDVNYFLQDRFTIGGGFDYSTAFDRTSFSTGIRYYWLDQAFFRSKIHVPLDFSAFDFSVGLGYNYMLGDDFGLESNLDYFIKGERATFRMGIALFL